MTTLVYDNILKKVKSCMMHVPTAGQEEALKRISNFIVKSGSGDTYLLKGYAGTGKTTLVSALVKGLKGSGVKTFLMAPTGRAAKVMSRYAHKAAYTIHRKIYRPKQTDGNWLHYTLAPNQHSNTLFIVDEASMISDTANDFSGSNLMSDLISYVKAGTNCRLLLVGDNAQLPPVGQVNSPALNIKTLTGKYLLRAGHYELTEVVRQERHSGILDVATHLRNELISGKTGIHFRDDFPDVKRVSGYELAELLGNSYNDPGPEDVVVICRSNKGANNYNRQIRYSGLWFEDEINAGDYLMCVKNNYFWLEADSPAGFIANGDMLRVTRVSGIREKFGFRFAQLTVEMVDYPDQPAIELNVILDSLYTEAPALTAEQSQRLFQKTGESYPDAVSRSARFAAVSKDEWFQALQVKFAYAVTCHKAQGGQWKYVFVDQGYLTEEMVDTGYLRWLYTALTRATEKVYLVNFHERFFNS